MGFWNKLGKLALTVAPYVAAPFTGGASLLAVPLANRAVGAWNERDANKQAQRGLGPSNGGMYSSSGRDGGSSLGYSGGGSNFSPNLAHALSSGRNEAIMNQPFRSGYDIRTQGDNDSVITSHMPSIFSGSQGGYGQKPESYAPALEEREMSFTPSIPTPKAKPTIFGRTLGQKTESTAPKTSTTIFGRTFNKSEPKPSFIKTAAARIEKRRKAS